MATPELGNKKPDGDKLNIALISMDPNQWLRTDVVGIRNMDLKFEYWYSHMKSNRRYQPYISYFRTACPMGDSALQYQFPQRHIQRVLL